MRRAELSHSGAKGFSSSQSVTECSLPSVTTRSEPSAATLKLSEFLFFNTINRVIFPQIVLSYKPIITMSHTQLEA